jgi:hypothetical protein
MLIALNATAAASPSPTSTATTPGLTSHQGALVLGLVVGGILVAGLIVLWGRNQLKSAQGSQDSSFIRSWIAIALVLGLLIFCGAALLGTNNSLQSILFGGLVASAGSAIAFYFAAQQGAAALNAVAAQAGTGPDTFSAITPHAGKTGTSYTYNIIANGLPTPTYQVVSGSLPSGLTLDSNGTLHGTPTTAVAAAAFKVGAFNASGLLISPDITIAITDP